METTTILSDYMIEDHDRFEKTYHEFKEAFNNQDKELIEAFTKFKWEMMKHFALEEKIVFTKFNPKDAEELKMIKDTEEEHKIMLKLVDDIDSFLKGGQKADISEIDYLMKKHREFEDNELYPKLDLELDDKTKNQIIQELKQPMDTEE